MYQINDPPGQKYSRNIRLKRFVLLTYFRFAAR